MLLIKLESKQVDSVISRIADASKKTTEELESLAKENPPLELKFTHLPLMEEKSRDLIEKDTGKQLISTSGVQFEFMLLQSQVQGMDYAANLAGALLESETSPKRRAFLQRTQKTFAAFHDEIYQMILNRYIR